MERLSNSTESSIGRTISVRVPPPPRVAIAAFHSAVLALRANSAMYSEATSTVLRDLVLNSFDSENPVITWPRVLRFRFSWLVQYATPPLSPGRPSTFWYTRSTKAP